MKKTRLNHYDRANILSGIAKHLSAAEIARKIDKNRTTVYREIINYSEFKEYRKCSNCVNKCSLFEMQKLLGEYGSNCEEYIPIICPKLKRFPFVCNACEFKSTCARNKRYYDCDKAHLLAKQNRSMPRQVIQTTPLKMEILDEIVSKGIDNGQSLHHIYVSNKEALYFISERTLRRYLYKNIFMARMYKLHRKPRYKKEYNMQKADYKRNLDTLFGRTFGDYKKFVEKNPLVNVWQLDSVIGKITDSKAILTLTYPPFRFQFGIYIKKGCPNSVLEALKKLRKKLGLDFSKIFGCFLADNGTEFYNLDQIEINENGEKDVSVFFTNPYKSTDKAHCERNHEFIRYIIPKSTTLNYLSQKKLNLIFSHINGYVRKSNNDKTPYELMQEKFGDKFLIKIGAKHINNKTINLTPELIK